MRWRASRARPVAARRVLKSAVCGRDFIECAGRHRDRERANVRAQHPIARERRDDAAKRLIRGRVISITIPLRRRAKELWSVLRAARASL